MLCEARVKFFHKLLVVPATAVLFVNPSLGGFAKETGSQAQKENNKNNLIAQLDQNEQTNSNLKITVTGTRTERQLRNYPGSVSIFDYDYNSEESFSSWRDYFKDEPGINSQDFLRSDSGRSYAKGDKGNINIRGLEGNRILTQIDGVTIPRFNYGNSTFSVSRLNFIDFNTLGKLEVLKGSGSSLYGSDAIGGVVSLKSIRPDDLLKPGDRYSIEIPANYSGANDSTNGAIKFAFRDKDFEAIVVTSKGSANELNRKTDEKFIDDFESDSQGLYTKVIKNIDENTEFGVTFENFKKESESTTKPDNLTGDYISAVNEADSERTRISFDFDYASSEDSNFDLVKGSLYFNKMDYENSYKERTSSGGTDNDHDLEQDTLGGSIQISNELMVGEARHLITYGIEASKFNGVRTAKDYVPDSQGIYQLKSGYPQKTVPETDVDKYGIYFQNEVSLGDLEIIGGIRYDYYDLDSIKDDDWLREGSTRRFVNPKTAVPDPVDISASSFNPHLAAILKVNDDTSIYGKYSKGFRAPTWEELNSSHFNIFGPANGAGYATFGDPDLDPERSDSFEIGLRQSKPKYDFEVATFYNSYDDFIEKSVNDGNVMFMTTFGYPISIPVLRSKNISEATIYGLEAKSTYYFDEKDKGLSLSNALSLTVGNDDSKDEPLHSINPFKLISSFKYKFPGEKVVAKFTNTFTGEPTVKDSYNDFKPDSWIKTDLEIGFNVSNSLKTSLGAFNIFDTKYYHWSDIRQSSDDSNHQRYAQPGRHLKAGFNYKF